MPTETTITEVTQSSTKLSNATTPKEVTTAEFTQSSTKLPNANSISELTEATTTVSDEDHSLSNIDWRDFLCTSTFEKSLPFFSNGLIARLRAWKKVLNNATTQCEKLTDSGTPIAKYLEIEFVDFRARYVDAKDDSDGEFLTLETFHPVLMRQQKDHDLVSVAYMSILELWPLLVLCFSCAALSGMIIWLLVCMVIHILSARKLNRKRVIRADKFFCIDCKNKCFQKDDMGSFKCQCFNEISNARFYSGEI